MITIEELRSSRHIERLGHPHFYYGSNVNHLIYIRDNGMFDINCGNKSLQTPKLEEAEQFLLDYINNEGKFAPQDKQIHDAIAVFHCKMQEIYGKTLPSPKLALIIYYDLMIKGTHS